MLGIEGNEIFMGESVKLFDFFCPVSVLQNGKQQVQAE